MAIKKEGYLPMACDDTPRLHRSDFIRYFPMHGVGAEVGVFKGEFSRCLLEIARPRRLHLIDLWSQWGEFFPDWGAYSDFGRLTTEEAFTMTLRNVRECSNCDVVTVHEGNSIEVLESFPDNSLDWAYLDSSHTYRATKAELDVLERKVNGSGLIAGHDWVTDPTHKHYGVMVAVQDFCERSGWTLWKRDGWLQWCLKNTST